jgi:NitT/TauT family transport system ATP-binding protein
MSLVIKNINKDFVSNLKTINVLADINLDIQNGKFICILGPSGCGKSTLLNVLAGLEKPTFGEVKLNGKIVKSPGPDRVVVFQEAALFPWLNVIDNIEFGMKMIGASKKERTEKALHYMNIMQLNGFSKALVHELSGGMKQRVALARAFCMDSTVLLMDEPFSSLDNQTKTILQDELLKLWNDTQKTIVFVTHSPEEAVYLADKVVLMSNRPCKIKSIIDISLDRPRNTASNEFIDTIKKLKESIKEEVDEDGQIPTDVLENTKKSSFLHYVAGIMGSSI